MAEAFAEPVPPRLLSPAAGSPTAVGAAPTGRPSVDTDGAAEPGPSAALLDDPVELARFTRWESGSPDAAAGQGAADAPRIGVSALQLSGLHCAACAGLIEDALRRVPGVLEATVQAASQRASVRWDPSRVRPSAFVEAVRRAGYVAMPDTGLSAREMRRLEQRSVLWRLFVGSFLAMQVMMLATPSYVAHDHDLAPDLAQLLNWGSWLFALPVMGFGGWPFFQGAWRALRARRIGMDVPVALGLAVTFLVSTVATFDPQGPFGSAVYFDSLTMFVAFLWFGRWLEMRARHRAADTLERAMSAMPERAWRVEADGRLTELPAARLQPGDRVRVPVGQAVPADGRLETESAGVAEALLTGESDPVPKTRGELLLAGSVNRVAPLEMVVERAGADTRQEAIVRLMRDALASRPASVQLADRLAGPFLWGVLLLAAASAAVWSVIDPPRAIWVGVAVLIVTCPCALSLATPATLVAAAAGLARRGVLLRRLDVLERVDGIGTLFIDKTGTLTLDEPVWMRTRWLAGAPPVDDERSALRQAAGLARWSVHPFSQALVRAAGLQEPAAGGSDEGWSAVQEHAGFGVQAVDTQGRTWRLGSARWAGAAGHPQALTLAAAAVWLSCDGRPVAAFEIDEQIRPGAFEAVRELRAQGLKLAMLSGDRRERAEALASRLGIDRVVAGADPQAKLATVGAAQAAGLRVAMVGDGINDAPVLAAADVSLAMGQGALVARQGADAVIVSGRLGALADLHATARRTTRIIRQNLAWALGYNLVCIPLAMAGWLPPWAAGLGMALSSVLVVAHAQRAGLGPDA